MDKLFIFIQNHWLLTSAFLTLIALLIIDLAKEKLLSFKSVRPTDALKLINHQDATILDVRDEEEYKSGHILNAIHIPLGLLSGRMGELEDLRNKPIIVCCKTGQLSAKAGTTLSKNGYHSVHKLDGGILAWKSSNLPLMNNQG